MSVWKTFAFAALGAFIAGASAADAAECGALRRLARFDIVPDGGGRPLIPVTLEGKRKYLLVDSGGFSSMLAQGTVRELGLRPSAAPTSVTAVNGARSTQIVRVREFHLGELALRNHDFWVDPNGAPGERIAEHDMAGHVGAEILRDYDTDFDFPAGSFSLFQQEHCEGTVARWMGAEVTVVPFRLNESLHITFPVTLDGKELNAILDTGAPQTLINLSVATNLFGLDLNAPDIQRVDELEGARRNLFGRPVTEAIYRRRFQELAMQGITVKSPMILLMPDMMGRVGGLPELIIGMSTLSKLHLYVSYRERKLYIATGSPSAVPAP